MEHGGEAAHSRAEYSPGFITIADLPDARDQQRPVLYLAQAVPQRRADGVVAVSAVPEPPSLPAPPPPEPPATAPTAGLVEVELPSGVKLRVTGDVDTGALRRILSALR